MNLHHNSIELEPEGLSHISIINLIDDIDLQKVVTGTQRAKLRPSTLLGSIGYGRGSSLWETTTLFCAEEILSISIPLPTCPGSALLQNRLQLRPRKPNNAFPTHSTWTLVIKGAGQLLKVRFHLLVFKVRGQHSHAAVDVISNSAWRYNALLIVESCHTANGKAISLVDVRHCHGIAHDARKHRYVDKLFDGPIPECLLKELLAGVDARRHTHAAVDIFG